MNFIYFGDFLTHWSTELYIADALKAEGCRVFRIHDDGKRSTDLVETIREHSISDDPAVFLFAKMTCPGRRNRPRNMTGEEIARVLHSIRRASPHTKVVCWTFDPVRAAWSPHRHQWATFIYPFCDLFLSTDAGTSGEKGLGGAKLLRQGYPGPYSCPPERGKRVGDFPACHLGSIYGERRPWMEKMTQAIPGFTSFNACRGDELFDLMASVKIVCGPHWPAFPGYWSNRIYVVTGYGGLFACPAVEGMHEEGWQPGEHYLHLPSNTTGMIQTLNDYLWGWSHPRMEEIRRNGRDLVLSRHTYSHRARDLITMVNAL